MSLINKQSGKKGHRGSLFGHIENLENFQALTYYGENWYNQPISSEMLSPTPLENTEFRISPKISLENVSKTPLEILAKFASNSSSSFPEDSSELLHDILQLICPSILPRNLLCISSNFSMGSIRNYLNNPVLQPTKASFRNSSSDFFGYSSRNYSRNLSKTIFKYSFKNLSRFVFKNYFWRIFMDSFRNNNKSLFRNSSRESLIK